MLTQVKLALRISGTTFNTEIQSLIDDAMAEMEMLGIRATEMSDDAQIINAVIFYCKARFGDNPDSEKWERCFLDKIGKLMVAAEYRR